MKNILNEVIREDNVQMLGEIIAIKALKTVASHSNGKLDYLYKGLLYDVYKRNTPNHKYSDGYDFAQLCFCKLQVATRTHLTEQHYTNFRKRVRRKCFKRNNHTEQRYGDLQKRICKL